MSPAAPDSKKVFPEAINIALRDRLAHARAGLGDLATPRVLKATRKEFLVQTAARLRVSEEAIRKHLDPTP